ncbi:MAG TPA: IclR family transcriptional regulator [Trueperaceae bacterium]|nr:IclR family transcriptional regulator [Trueperaceae bacterium]
MGSQQLLTIQRAIAYLVQLADGGPTTAQQLAARFDVPTSTVYRYVAALKDAGMVWELPGGRLGLGPRCVQLEVGFRRALDAWSPYRPVMRDLAAATGETVALLVPVDAEAVCIDTVESDKPLRYTFSKGVAKPMLRGASAKAMLAYMPEERLECLLADDAAMDEHAREALLAELPVIRQRGYAVSQEEVDQGVWAVGVPVLNGAGEIEGSLSIIAPTFRVKGREAFLIRATLEAGTRIPSIQGRELVHAV